MENQTTEKAEKPLFKLPETDKEFEKEFATIKEKHTLSDGQLERIRKVTIEKFLQKEKAKIAQRRAASELAKAKLTAKSQERRDDTRKKIIAGALLLSMQDDPAWKESIASLLNTITKDTDRALFGLEPLPKPDVVTQEPQQETTEATAEPQQEPEATEAVETVAEVPQEPQAEDEPQQPTQMSEGLRKWFNKT